MTTNIPQAIVAPLTSAAIFLVVDLKPVPEARDIVQGLCGDLSALVRSVRFRDQTSQLSCVAGFGPDAWDRIFGGARPPELHAFREIDGMHRAPSTQGDLRQAGGDAGRHHRPQQADRHRAEGDGQEKLCPQRADVDRGKRRAAEDRPRQHALRRFRAGHLRHYFIGYACSPARTEKMLENMFVGNPPGNYDRLLDVSRAVTGSLFFCPTATFLDDCPGTM